MMEHLLTFFCKKTPSLIFVWILNRHLGKLKSLKSTIRKLELLNVLMMFKISKNNGRTTPLQKIEGYLR